jgi:N-acetylmuramic acid 6-phosphate etherase
MILLGKTYGNLMVDMRASNAKLADRAERIVMEVTGISRERARAQLAAAGGLVKTALVMQMTGADRSAAEQLLADHGGFVRRVIPGAPPPVAK